MELKLPSGFIADFGNLYGEGKVSLSDLTEIKDRLAAAHEAIEWMRETGEVRGHLSKDGKPEKVLFTKLPYIQEGNINSLASLSKIKAFGESLRYQADAVVSLGIGGSYLGNKVIFDVECGEFWNYRSQEERKGYPKVYFSGNNIDPRRTSELIAHLVRQAEDKACYKVVLIIISKSGSTFDTMANFMVLYEALNKHPHISVEVVAVTGQETGEEETLLHKLAVERGWKMFSVPEGVGGRFTVFTEVSFSTAVCTGFDIDAFLAGARAMDEACRSADVFQNPAMLNAALKYLASEKYGRTIEVFMPYGEHLRSVAEWYVQLLAESLGKRCSRRGTEICYGRTPVVAVGSADMHAQTQQHQDGRKDKVVQFVKVGKWPYDPTIPDVFPEATQLSEVSGIPMGQALDIAREANAEALSKDGRFNASFILPELNAFHLGELLYMLALSVAYEGELADVDAFDQPGIEAYKRIMKSRLKVLHLHHSRLGID